MAYSMFLKGPGFDRESWRDAFCDAYVDGESEVRTPLSALSHQMSGLEDGLDGEHIWLHPAGGVRGVTVKQEEEGVVELSLPLGFNRTDFDLAWDLMRLGVKHGALPSDEERDSLTMEDGEMEEISGQQLEFYWGVMMSRLDSELTLPVGGLLSLTLKPEDGSEGIEGLKARLADRMNRYSSAHVASLMKEQGGDGDRLLSNYGHIPSLIHERARFIATHGEGGALVEGLIPADHFYGVLGDRVEDLGEWKYVPGIDFSAEPEIAEALRGQPARREIPKPTIAMQSAQSAQSAQQGFTGEDWALLGKAPCLVFLLVAAADGGIDRKEILSFGATLEKQRGGQSVVFSRILQITMANFEAFLNEIASSGVSVPEQLLQVGLLLQSGKIPREDALVVARQLCELGTAIASASGGGLFGFGSKISKEEAKVLKFLETLLVSCAMTSGES